MEGGDVELFKGRRRLISTLPFAPSALHLWHHRFIWRAPRTGNASSVLARSVKWGNCETDHMSATTTTNENQPLNHSEWISTIHQAVPHWLLTTCQVASRQKILFFPPQARNKEAVLSHLLRLLGFLLRVPCIPVVHTSLLLRWRSEQAVYEWGRGC